MVVLECGVCVRGKEMAGGCWCSALCCRMTVFVEKARKMGRTSLIAELDRYVHTHTHTFI